MAYLLDANVFIEAKQRYYAFNLAPGFWDWLEQANADGTVYSIEKVADELDAVDDELKDWARARGEAFFRPGDADVYQAMGKVSEWVTSQSYEQVAIDAFLDDADYYLVAHALAKDYTLVTHERPAPESKKKIKIPDACIGVDVKFVNAFMMLRKERVRFILG